MRRICVVLTARGNFAKAKSVMRAMLAHPRLELQLVVGGALLNRQAIIFEEIQQEGFPISATLDYVLMSETPSAIGTSAALCMLRMTEILNCLKPDVLLVIADRYEALAIAQAAVCANVRIAHLEGGELSGSIDERIRHAITKLSHYHFPANEEAAERIVRMGESRESIAVVGSPSFDLLIGDHSLERLRQATEALIDFDRPFVLVSQHPVVTEYADASIQFRTLAESIVHLALPAIWIWPNNDAGAAKFGEALDWIKERTSGKTVVVSALPIEDYGAALARAACLIGNSSSGIREAAFLGTPTVNIGTRQMARERSTNVADVACETGAIVKAVRAQIAHGRYRSDPRYGDGTAGIKIASFLADYWPSLDKAMAY
jgi:UDP-hydrolysing UDP-N-acetyl-D-glucosamine 2-epimerase